MDRITSRDTCAPASSCTESSRQNRPRCCAKRSPTTEGSRSSCGAGRAKLSGSSMQQPHKRRDLADALAPIWYDHAGNGPVALETTAGKRLIFAPESSYQSARREVLANIGRL